MWRPQPYGNDTQSENQAGALIKSHTFDVADVILIFLVNVKMQKQCFWKSSPWKKLFKSSTFSVLISHLHADERPKCIERATFSIVPGYVWSIIHQGKWPHHIGYQLNKSFPNLTHYEHVHLKEVMFTVRDKSMPQARTDSRLVYFTN